MQVKRQQLKLDMEQLGKLYDKAVYCHPTYLTSMQSTSCKMLGWMNHSLASRLPGEIPTTSDMQKIKILLMRVKEESEKAGLKLSIQKTNIMASSSITSWQIDMETMEMVTDFFSLGSKFTVDVDCHHEIKRCLLLGRKGIANLAY